MSKLSEKKIYDYKELVTDMIENKEEYLEECKHDNLFELSLILSEEKFGEEDRKHMPRRLKHQLDKLEELQRKGLRIEHDGKTYDLKMHLHLVSDAKFLQLTHGGARFCDEQPNCLKCFSKPEDRDDPTVR